MRRPRSSALLRLLAAATALALLVLTVVLGMRSAAQVSRNQQELRMRSVLGERAAATQEYFERARTITLLVAHNPAFRQLYAGGPPTSATLAADGPAVVAAQEALRYVEDLYPGVFGEACFIDHTGRELARVVNGRAAPAQELSADETGSTFFAPTFAAPEGAVVQTRAYTSPDTHSVVLGNATRVPNTAAIVHFEVDQNAFANPHPAGSDTRVQIVELTDGSRIADDSPHGGGGVAAYARSHGGAAVSGRFTLGNRTAIWQRVTAETTNANDWAVVVSTDRLGVLAGVTWSTAAGAAAALLLLVMVGASLRAQNRSLTRAATTDTLTDLPNRTLFESHAAQVLARASREEGQAAVLLLDLNGFKEVNDTLGHHQGDLLLQLVAQRLRSEVRGSDLVARLGGDEFAVVVDRLGAPADAIRVATKIATALTQPFQLEGLDVHAGASIGISLYPDHGHSVADLVQRADVAMYYAKSERLGHSVYDPTLDTNSLRRLHMVSALRQAILNDELALHYQPKVDLLTGSVVGVEALARWTHPEFGTVPPPEFIGLAESHDLIDDLTDWVLETGLAQARLWADDGHDLTLAVNLSPQNLLNPHIVAIVAQALARHGIAPDKLEIELTEGMLLNTLAEAARTLTALSELGVRIAVDDFGAGHASLAYLRHLPLGVLKIDRAYVAGMGSNGPDAAIVSSTIDLAHALGLTVVAEGVEDAETTTLLTQLGCDFAQGYHLGRPMPAEQLRLLLRGGMFPVLPAPRTEGDRHLTAVHIA